MHYTTRVYKRTTRYSTKITQNEPYSAFSLCAAWMKALPLEELHVMTVLLLYTWSNTDTPESILPKLGDSLV